jgi:hypothetical protein
MDTKIIPRQRDYESIANLLIIIPQKLKEEWTQIQNAQHLTSSLLGSPFVKVRKFFSYAKSYNYE